MLSSFYRGLVTIGNNLQDLFLLVIRIYWGYIFYSAGAAKFENIQGTIQSFQSLGIPFAEYNTYLASGVEYGGGVCLIIGLASRLVSIPLAITMIVALGTAHLSGTLLAFSDPAKFLIEPPVTFLLVVLMIFCFGPGRISMDQLLENTFSKKGKR